jgi:hypothetical protein
VGGRGQNFESRILFGRGKCSKMAQNPTRQVHALLGRCGLCKTLLPKDKTQPFCDLILHAPSFFTSPTLLKPKLWNYQNTKAEGLPKPLLQTDFAKKLICQKK